VATVFAFRISAFFCLLQQQESSWKLSSVAARRDE
jgi:hypothetical protein